MKVFNGLDEFVAAAGSELGPTEWLEITQDRINAFAAQVGTLWLLFWERHAEDEVFSRPYWC